MSTVTSWISMHARRTPDRIAVEDLAFDRTISYGELSRRVDALAGHLAAVRGVGRGDRVAVLSRNSHHVIEIQYACAALGAIFVPLNWRLSAAELTDIGRDCAPAVLIGESFLAEKADAVTSALGVPGLVWLSEAGGPDAYEAALAAAVPAVPAAPAVPVVVDTSEPWTIIYTSGTTGTSKGVIISHASAEATMLGILVGTRLHTDATTLTILPYCHVAGLNFYTNPTLYLGARVVVMREFSPRTVLDQLTARKVPLTHFGGVPAVLQAVTLLPEWPEVRLENLVTLVGGAPVATSLVQEWAAHGSPPQTVYGISEAGACVLLIPAGQETDHPGSVGLPLMQASVVIADDTGTEVPAGTVGEVLVSGPSVTPGYWRNPALTAQSIDERGRLHTGDAAYADEDGYIHIVDRFKDMYISGGENVYPAEIENVLYQHPAVAEAAVVGLPDERWGEVGHAFIVPRDGQEIDPEDIRAFVRARLAPFKTPHHVSTMAALPRNTTGKILKRELKAGRH